MIKAYLFMFLDVETWLPELHEKLKASTENRADSRLTPSQLNERRRGVGRDGVGALGVGVLVGAVVLKKTCLVWNKS